MLAQAGTRFSSEPWRFERTWAGVRTRQPRRHGGGDFKDILEVDALVRDGIVDDARVAITR
jgi:hypothetical protein